jgi:hypothetical protein
VFFQVDQLVFEELVRERFPKLGLYFVAYIIFAVFHLYEAFWVVFLCHLYIYCSESSRLPGSAGGLGYWAVVPFHFYEHASMGKWSGFMLYLVNIKAYFVLILIIGIGPIG